MDDQPDSQTLCRAACRPGKASSCSQAGPLGGPVADTSVGVSGRRGPEGESAEVKEGRWKLGLRHEGGTIDPLLKWAGRDTQFSLCSCDIRCRIDVVVIDDRRPTWTLWTLTYESRFLRM